MTARPTIGVGKVNGGIVKSPRAVPVCSSSVLATAMISPGPATSIGSVRCALHA